MRARVPKCDLIYSLTKSACGTDAYSLLDLDFLFGEFLNLYPTLFLGEQICIRANSKET